MVWGALIGSGVTLGCLLPPLVHFVTGPLGPFIGGFFAGSKMQASPGQAVGMGVLMGLFLALPAFGIMSFWVEGSLRLVISGALLGYIAALGTAGALVGSSVAMRAQ